MSYIEHNLLAGEKIVHFTKQHVVLYFTALLWSVLLLIVALLGKAFQFLLLPMLVITVLAWFSCYVRYKTAEFVVTNKRIVLKVGWLRKQIIELFLNRIESIYIEQSLLGQWCGYGTIIIKGVGGTRDVFYQAPDPFVFRAKIQEQSTAPQHVVVTQLNEHDVSSVFRDDESQHRGGTRK